MAIRFVLGRAGSGKTRHCLDSIAARLREGPEGPPLILLVPEQATFQMERALLRGLGSEPDPGATPSSASPPASPASPSSSSSAVPSSPAFLSLLDAPCRAFTRARVLSFRRLAHWIFNLAGPPDSPPIGDVQRRLILRLLLRRHRADLEVFGRSAGQPGFEDELARVLSEFLRQRIGPEALRSVSMALDEQGDGAKSSRAYLGAKLRDLALLLEGYGQTIAGRFSNPEEDLDHLARGLQRCPLPPGTRLWVDGFASFTPQELHALDEILVQVKSADVCLCLDPTALDDPAGAAPLASVPAARNAAKGRGFSLFAETTRTFHRLSARVAARGLAVAPALPLPRETQPTRFSAAADLAHLEREFSAAIPRPWTAASRGVRLCEAPSPRLQAEAAARELTRLHREEGMRWGEMAVLCRDLDAALPYLLPALQRHGVPRFVDRRRSLGAHPLPNALQAAARAVLLGWNSGDVFEFLKSGLAPVATEAVDRLENYTREHGITGARSWTALPTWTAWPRRSLDEEEPWERGEEDVRRTEALGRINQWRTEATAPLLDWAGAHFAAAPRETNAEDPSPAADPASPSITGRALGQALRDLLARLDAEAVVARWEEEARARGDLGRAEEHRQAPATINSAVEQLASALEDEALTPAEAVEALEAAFEDLRIGVIPAGLDETLLGAVDRSRQPDLRAALVLGLAEGEFPRVRPQDPLLTDPEREALRAHGCEVAPPAAESFLNEYYYAYIALTRADTRLWVARPLADAGGDVLPPSPFWKQLRRLFPAVAVEKPLDAQDDWTHATTPLDWLRLFAAHRREPPDETATRAPPETSTPASGALRDFLALWSACAADDSTDADRLPPPPDLALPPTAPPPARFEPLNPRTATPRDRLARFAPIALRGAVPTAEAALDPARAQSALLRDPDAASVSLSQFESFTRCPFRHFARYLLRLEERREYRVELVDLGSLYHAVLNLWVRDAIRDGLDMAKLGEDDIQRAVRGLTDRIAPRLKNELLLSSARFRYLIESVKETLVQVGKTLVAALGRGDFRPLAVEVSFQTRGRELPPLEIELSGGRRLRFRGRIDRVDAAPPAADGSVGVCVVDYKMGQRLLDLGSVVHGLDLQLGGYLLALTRGPGAAAYLGGTPVPVGAFYMSMLETPASFTHPDDVAAESEEDRHRRRKKRGMFGAEWLDRIEPLEAGEKAVFHQAARKRDGEIGASGDALAREDLALVLDHIGRMLRDSGEAMLDGRIAVAPARYGTKTGCEFCPYGAVCRIDPVLTPWREMRKFGGRAGALDAMRTTRENARDTP